MSRYPPERKAALLKKLFHPTACRSPSWRKQAKAGGAAVPGDQKRTDDWSAEAKLAVVIETAPLSEIELSEYCRSKGLFPQVKAWREADQGAGA